MSWKFQGWEKRLRFELPKSLGGRTYEVCLDGGYTFHRVTGVAAAV